MRNVIGVSHALCVSPLPVARACSRNQMCTCATTLCSPFPSFALSSSTSDLPHMYINLRTHTHTHTHTPGGPDTVLRLRVERQRRAEGQVAPRRGPPLPHRLLPWAGVDALLQNMERGPSCTVALRAHYRVGPLDSPLHLRRPPRVHIPGGAANEACLDTRDQR